jgi:SAM-dependent methyltransferase
MTFYAEFSAVYEQVFPFREDVYAFLRDHLPPTGRRVLDLGCGPGHYCGRFVADGQRAVGVDLDGEMIRQARLRYPRAIFHALDMADVGRLAIRCDLAVCIGNSAAHLPPTRLEDLLAGLAQVLARPGRWILQVVNWDRILAHGYHAFPDRRLPEGLVFHREYRNISPGQVEFCTRLVGPGGELFRGQVMLYPVTRRQYERRAAVHGLLLREILGVRASGMTAGLP